MKRFLIVLFIISSIIFLTSCQRKPTAEELYDSLFEDYSELEDKYYSASSRVDELEHALSDINDIYMHACFSVTEDDNNESAFTALEKIGDILYKLGY